MGRKEPSKEARLGEVLAEVSLVDVWRIVKGGLATMGCLGVFFAIIFAITSVSESAGYGMDDLGVPNWLVWLLLSWAFVYSATSETSWHELSMSWYFPKLGWMGSLILAAYLVGFAYLFIWVSNMEVGVERLLSFLIVWLGYTSPFLLFLSAISVGHTKLMEKRMGAATA